MVWFIVDYVSDIIYIADMFVRTRTGKYAYWFVIPIHVFLSGGLNSLEEEYLLAGHSQLGAILKKKTK